MKLVSIQDLQANLSALIAEAESGETILITRHNAPVVSSDLPDRHPFIAAGTSALAESVKH